jgi:hypothetical protein
MLCHNTLVFFRLLLLHAHGATTCSFLARTRHFTHQSSITSVRKSPADYPAIADRHTAGSSPSTALLARSASGSSTAECLCTAGSTARRIQLQPARHAAGWGAGTGTAAALDA